MANLEKRLPENAPGDFFVDSTCIDCDACRQIAPAVFLVESVVEHLRQHERVTEADRQTQERVQALHRGDAPPVVTHLVAGVHNNEKHNEGE